MCYPRVVSTGAGDMEPTSSAKIASAISGGHVARGRAPTTLAFAREASWSLSERTTSSKAVPPPTFASSSSALARASSFVRRTGLRRLLRSCPRDRDLRRAGLLRRVRGLHGSRGGQPRPSNTRTDSQVDIGAHGAEAIPEE